MALPARFLSGERLRAMLTPQAALEAVQRFFATHPREAVVVPERLQLPVPGRTTTGFYMPAATAQFVALKSVHLLPQRTPSVQAEAFLYDAESGELLFWADGKPLTALRTAAVSTAATLRLLPDCRRAIFYGAGVQAASHVTALAAAYPGLEVVHAVTRSAESFTRLCNALDGPLRSRLRRCERPEGELGDVDCVITTTPAPAPLFEWAHLGPRCHVVGIGSATPAMNELPPAAFLAGRVWLDTRSAIEESGDLHAAVHQGWSGDRLAGDLFDLLGPGPPPTRGDGRTVFKSVGHAAQDLAILTWLWERLRTDPA